MREGKRKGRGIDYNREVAFEKRPTAGFYDTGEEKEMTKEMGKEFRPVTLEEMEGKRRKVSIYSSIFANRIIHVSGDSGRESLWRSG